MQSLNFLPHNFLYYSTKNAALDLVLQGRRYFYVRPDTLEMVRTLLEGNKKAAPLSLYTSYRRLGGPLMKAVRDVEKYPDRVPNDFAFVTEQFPELSDEEKNATTLSTGEQFKMMFDCFSLMAKVAYLL